MAVTKGKLGRGDTAIVSHYVLSNIGHVIYVLDSILIQIQ
jgi:hypothetical protein